MTDSTENPSDEIAQESKAGWFETLRDWVESDLPALEPVVEEVELYAGIHAAALLVTHLNKVNPDAKRQFEELFNKLNP
jgi:hypothetical protein